MFGPTSFHKTVGLSYYGNLILIMANARFEAAWQPSGGLREAPPWVLIKRPFVERSLEASNISGMAPWGWQLLRVLGKRTSGWAQGGG